MILYNASTSEGLINFTHYITNTDSGTYSDADLTAALNMYYSFVVNEVLDSMDGWDFQGEVATTTLVANQQEYVFPTDLVKFKRCEISYDGVNWYRVETFDINERGRATDSKSISEDFDQSQPFMDLDDGSLFLYPIPTQTVSAGLKIWYEKEITPLANDTDEPTFSRAYHKILCFGAAKDYFMQNIEIEGFEAKIKIVNSDFDKMLERMKNYYNKKTQDNHYELSPGYVEYDYGYKY